MNRITPYRERQEEAAVLRRLSRMDGVTPTELARRMRRTSGWTGKVLRRLVRQGRAWCEIKPHRDVFRFVPEGLVATCAWHGAVVARGLCAACRRPAPGKLEARALVVGSSP